MKKILFAAFAICSLVANAQQKQTKPALTKTTITPAKPTVAVAPAISPATASSPASSPAKFEKLKHSFGKIKQNIPQTFVFNLKNTGAKPLIIEQCTAQCGCTTPEYSKSPVLKGKSTPIKVTYNAAAPGAFTKTVTVKFLGVAEPTILTIDGEVLKSAEPAPAAAGH